MLTKRSICIVSVLVAFALLFLSMVPQVKAKDLGYKWYYKYVSVSFYTGFNTNWKTEINSSMATWNAIKETSTGYSIVPMALTASSSVGNTIYSTSNNTWLGKMFPTLSDGNLSTACIAVNSGDYSFCVGATKGQYDIQTLMVHELGHAIGIAHCHEIADTSTCFSSTCTSNVMTPQQPDNTTRRSLHGYDSASKKVLYNFN